MIKSFILALIVLGGLVFTFITLINIFGKKYYLDDYLKDKENEKKSKKME